MVFIISFIEMYAHSKVINGKVFENDKTRPAIGATIVVKGTTVGTITDVNGNFTIESKSEDDILVFSFLGYETIEKSVKDKYF